MGANREKIAIRGKLSEFILETHYDNLPKEVIHQTKRCILDFLGTAVAGCKIGLAPLMAKTISEMGGKKEATIIGTGSKMPALNAALLNGVQSHTLDMDDGHRYANGHPGVAILPAALALAERENVTGQELIESIVVGYETFIRIAKFINPSHLKRGFHTTGTVGPFGAAAACSKILHLNKTEIENAISIAGLMGSGLLEVLTSGQMMKPIHPGRASQAGLLASLLAKERAIGPELIFEGEKGFFNAFSDTDETTNFSCVIKRDYEILNIYFKVHAACRHIHPTLDAIMEICHTNEMEISEIKEIEVHTYSVAINLTGQNIVVDDELAAKFSLPTSVALMLLYGKAGNDEYVINKIKNPLVRSLAKKVRITVDESMEKTYPAKRGARVTIKTVTGVHSSTIDLPKGEPENPFDEDEFWDKFLQNATKVLPAKKLDLIKEAIFNVENKSIRELMSNTF